jgi:hypothetical protein
MAEKKSMNDDDMKDSKLSHKKIYDVVFVCFEFFITLIFSSFSYSIRFHKHILNLPFIDAYEVI